MARPKKAPEKPRLKIYRANRSAAITKVEFTAGVIETDGSTSIAAGGLFKSALVMGIEVDDIHDAPADAEIV